MRGGRYLGINPNIFSIVENRETIKFDEVYRVKKTTFQAEPNTVYTAHTNVPVNSSNGYSDVFVDREGRAIASTTNGLDSGKTYTFSTDGTGKITVYGRDSNLTSGATDFNDIFNGKFYLEIEKGDKATAPTLAVRDQIYILNKLASSYL